MSVLWEPFQYQFMQQGLAAAVLVGLTCAVLGVYVVLRRMAFIGDALAHTALPGVVTAYLQGWSLFGGAVAAGLLTALGISWMTRHQKVREDTAIGILFTGMFALGLLMISTLRSFRDFTHILFGNILAVTLGDLGLMAGVSILVLGLLFLFHKELKLSSVDPSYARVIGLNPDRLRTLLLVLLALTVTTGLQAVGVVLTSALLVTPAAAANLITKRFGPMMAWSAAFAVGSGVAGLYLSYYLNVSSGASIVLTCTLCFLGAWLWARLKNRQTEEPSAEAGD